MSVPYVHPTDQLRHIFHSLEGAPGTRPPQEGWLALAQKVRGIYQEVLSKGNADSCKRAERNLRLVLNEISRMDQEYQSNRTEAFEIFQSLHPASPTSASVKKRKITEEGKGQAISEDLKSLNDEERLDGLNENILFWIADKLDSKSVKNLTVVNKTILKPLMRRHVREKLKWPYKGRLVDVRHMVTAYLPSISSLDLTENFRAGFRDEIEDLLRIPGILHLNFSYCSNSSPEGGLNNLTFSQVCEGFTGLKTLNLNYCKSLTPSSFSALSKLVRLENLHIGWTQFSSPELRHLESLSSLQSLDLSGSQVRQFAPLTSLTTLTRLCLNRTNMSSNGLKHVLPLTRLRALHVGGNTKLGNQAVAELTKLTQLVELSLSQTNLTDPGLAPLRHFTKLHTLDVSINPRCTDVGLSSLPTSICELNLDYFGQQAPQISRLQRLTNLSRLILSECTDTELRGLRTLKSVRVLGLKFKSQQGVRPDISLLLQCEGLKAVILLTMLFKEETEQLKAGGLVCFKGSEKDVAAFNI